MKKNNVMILGIFFFTTLFALNNTDISDDHSVLKIKNPQRAVFKINEQYSRDILWSQIPNPANAIGLSCQLDSVYPFESDVADDIDPDGAGWAIDSVRSWWSNWAGFYGWYNVPNIHFLVYADSGTTPPQPVDSPFVELIVDIADYTATSIGTDQWVVDMELPSTVELAYGEKYWIEVQPSNDFTMNGQTGWMGESGIGNGQDLYQRFPEIGIDIWTSALVLHGIPYETGFELIGNPMSTLLTWDFETGWQGWTHTNGEPFPAGWSVYDSQYKTGSGYICPAPDDSSMWIDSDSAGSGYGQVADTCISPIIIPLSNSDWLYYCICFNCLENGDWLEVGLKYFDGSTWFSVPLQTYTADINSLSDSVNISAYKTYDLIQIYFYYDDNNTWAWFAAFDNIMVNGVLSQDFHDVGVTGVHIPPYVLPGFMVDVDVTFRNFGDFTENFDCCISIDSAGVNIYSQIANMTLDPGCDSTVSFADMITAPTSGIVYDGIAYTYLATDMNPANDTMHFQFLTASHFWEILGSLPVISSGHYGATVHDSTYMVFGIHQTGQYLNDTYIYDIINDTWSQGPDNPYGCGAYGMAFGVGGKYYRFGGSDSMIIPNDRVDIYDPVMDLWSQGMQMPDSNMDMSGGVYRDSLVYMFGGGNWVGFTPLRNDVYFYDTYEDTWTQVTSIPGVARGCLGGGIIDSFAVVVAGYNGTSNYLSDYIVGTIDPADPSIINWGSPGTIPGGFEGRCRFCYGVEPSFDKELWIAGGRGNTLPQCPDLWSYQPLTDIWTNWNAPMNLAVANVSCVPMTYTVLGDIGFFVAGGYTGSYTDYHEVFHTSNFGVEENTVHRDLNQVFGFAADIKNPVKGYSAVTYTTTIPGRVSVKIYDNTGRLVKNLIDRAHEPAGTKTVYWNAKDDNQRTVANGVYFVRLKAEERTDTYKIVLIK